MSSTFRNILVLVLSAILGCQSAARPSQWQTQRVPSSPPATVSPSKPQTSSPWSKATPADAFGKRVPDPTPDPQSRSSRASDKLNVQTNKPVAPETESPQLRFTPVQPRSPSEKEPTDGSAIGSREFPGGETTQEAFVSPPKTVVPSLGTKTPAGPSLGFEALPPPNDSPLNLVVKGPRQRPVGGTVTFDIVARNDGTETITNVLLSVEFEDALVFPGSEEKRLTKNLGQLLPGQSREMRLTLASSRLGRHECRFSATADGVQATDQIVKVEFTEAKLLVRLIGPARRTVGSRAEFTIKVANSSDQPIDDLQVALHHDAALTPVVATGGFQKSDHSLSWSLGRLEAGAGVQLQAEFDCRQLSEQACMTVEARSEKLSAVAVEDCVTVVAVPGLLDLQVSDRADPVKVGDEVEFEINVQNLGLQSVADVQIDVFTSEHLVTGTHLATLGDREVTLTQTDRDGTLRLVMPNSLPPDATLKILLRTKVARAGDAELRAVAAVGSDGSPIETIEYTSINP